MNHSRPFYERKPVAVSALALLLCLLFAGCPADMWIAVNGIHRPAVAKGHVIYLESPPQRPYEVIGIITPEAGEYNTEAEAVKDMLAQAAKHGADAIFVESQTESSGWKVGSVGGLSGGSNPSRHAFSPKWRD